MTPRTALAARPSASLSHPLCMILGMALIEANRLTVTIPNGPDDRPDDAVAADRIHGWLERQYGYRPPVEHVEGHGWSDRWRVGGRTAPGWRYDAVIPRHLGPAPAAAGARSRAHHPANKVHVPPVRASRSSATARAAAGAGAGRRADSLFPDLDRPRPS